MLLVYDIVVGEIISLVLLLGIAIHVWVPWSARNYKFVYGFWVLYSVGFLIKINGFSAAL